MQTAGHYIKKAAPQWCSLFILLFFRLVLFMGYVPTESMEPTIGKGDFILGSRIYPSVKQGDVAVFKKDGVYLVKRIIALPGETVYVNPETGEFGFIVSNMPAVKTIHIAENHYFVVGDNQEHSYDSRYWADPCIEEDQIIAVLFGV